MNVEYMILYLIGGVCTCYLIRRVLHLAKGESGCSSCSGCPAAKNGCCGKRPPEESDRK